MPLSKDQFLGIFNGFKRKAVEKFNRRESKIDDAIGDLQKVADEVTQAGGNAKRFYKYIASIQKKVSEAEVLGASDPAKAYKSLEKVKKQAREQCDNARRELHDTAFLKETRTKVEGFDHPLQLHPQSMPGFDELDSEKRKEVVKKVAAKIANGKKLFDMLKNDDDDLPPPSTTAIADLTWFIKTMAEEKAGEAFAKGAITIPDAGKKLRDYIDQCAEIYGRDSSHLKEQQGGEKGQARGIDYYEGSLENVDLLLPYGMSTVLTQSVETSKGEDRLYIKMETEGARFNPTFKKQDDTPESRKATRSDFGHSVLHLVNLLKAHEDGSLASFREQTPAAIATAFANCVKAAKKDSPEVAEAMQEGYKVAKSWYGKKKKDQGNSIRINQITDNFDKVMALEDVSVPTMEAVVTCLNEINAAFGTDDADSRFGGEILLGDDDLTGKKVQVQDEEDDLGSDSILDDDLDYPEEVIDLWVAARGGDLEDLIQLLEDHYKIAGLEDFGRDTLVDALKLKRHDTPPPANEKQKKRREKLRKTAAATAKDIPYSELARALVKRL